VSTEQVGMLLHIFSVRCNIYILRLCYNVSVHLSVMEVHWRIIANLGFKFRYQFTAHCGRTEPFIVQWARGKGSLPGRVGDHLVLC